MLIEMEVLNRYIGEEGHVKKGQIIRVEERRAKVLSDMGNARVLVRRSGPSENKLQRVPQAEERPEGNSSGTQTAGLSIDTASSSVPGAEAPQSSLLGDLASALTKPMRASRRAKKASDSEPSQ